MRTLVLVLWFVSFFLTMGTVENLNVLFWLSFTTLGLTTYIISKNREIYERYGRSK